MKKTLVAVVFAFTLIGDTSPTQRVNTDIFTPPKTPAAAAAVNK